VTELRAHNDHHGVVEVYQFFIHSTHRFDRAVYNALISHFAKTGDQEKVKKLQDLMQKKQIAPDLFTYNALLKVSMKERDLQGFENVLQKMTADNIEPNIVTYNQKLTLLTAKGMWDEFEHTRAQMEENGIQSDRETYHIIMKRYARRGLWGDVNKLLSRMKVKGIDPNVRTYNSLFKYAMNLLQWSMCDSIWKEIKKIGPSDVSFNLRLRQVAESAGDDSTQTEELMKEMEAQGLPANSQVYSTLIRIAHTKGKRPKKFVPESNF
jgi:pentatricopeptide repeat protein